MRTAKKAAGSIALVAIVLTLAMRVLSAQIPGQNINVVSIDPYLQKQNEPSLSLSAVNPCHVVMGANDYRTVNLPGALNDEERHDAWVGVYQSTDCGQTWIAGLMPGYPQDKSAFGLASPAKGFTTAADPVVRSGPGGFVGYLYIVFNRGTNVGKLLLARLIDLNNYQITASTNLSQDPLEVPATQWPVNYVSPTLTVAGNEAQFLDKPGMTITGGPGTCTIGGRTIPQNVVHIVWTTFLNNSQNPATQSVSRVNYNSSSNCGVSLDRTTALKLSESSLMNQGASVAVSPVTGAIYVVWKQFDKMNPAITNMLFVKSVDGGKSFSFPQQIPTLSGLAYFDQFGQRDRFRTLAYPTIAFDHLGRLYVMVSARTAAEPQQPARITLTTTTDGVNWTPPTPVAPSNTPEHQIMPALSYSSAKLRLAWYDFIDDASNLFDFYVDDAQVLAGAPPRIRHTVDVRGAEGTFTGSNVTWNVYGVMQRPSLAAKISQYLMGVVPGGILQLLQWNRSGLNLYCGGNCAFIGDYIDVNGLTHAPQPTAESLNGTGLPNWVVNGPATADAFPSDFHAAWTDNRDAIVDTAMADKGATVMYSAPGNASCTPALTLTRNANVYTSRMTPGLSLLMPVNALPSNGVQRSLPMMIVNGTEIQRTFNLTIQNQPPDGTASFAQTGPMTSILVTIPARSAAARTVFYTSSTKYPTIKIFAAENVANPTLTAAVVANPDPNNADYTGSVATSETHSVLINNADIANPDYANPDYANPDYANPDYANPDYANPDYANTQVESANLDNATITNAAIQNPDYANPDYANPDYANVTLVEGSTADVSYTLTNTGNTATAYQVDVEITGKKTDPYLFQLVGRRVYGTPTAQGCTTVKTGQNQLLFNVSSPDVSTAGLLAANDPSPKNATLMLLPGEAVKITLRVVDKDAAAGTLSGPNDPKLDRFCPFADADAGCTAKSKTHDVTLRVRPQAADTGSVMPIIYPFIKP